MMGILAAWGVGESVGAACIVTVLEVLGLLFVIAFAGHHLAAVPARWEEILPLSGGALPGVLLGAYLAFFAFIGFEDIVNMAEEVKNPRVNIPRAIVISLSVSTL